MDNKPWVSPTETEHDAHGSGQGPPALPSRWLVASVERSTQRLGVAFTLGVRLGQRPPLAHQVGWELESSAAKAVDLHLLLQAPAFSTLDSVAHTLPLAPADHDAWQVEQAVSFQLCPLTPGTQRLEVGVFLDEAAVTTLALQVQVEQVALRGGPAPRVTTGHPAPPPYAVLRVITLPERGGATQRWSLELLLPPGALGGSLSRGDVRGIPSSLVALAGDLLADVLVGSPGRSQADRRQRLASLGRYLASRVLPPSMRRRLVELGDAEEPPPLLLLLDRGAALPWELLEVDGFLAERFRLTRWPLEAEEQRPTQLPVGVLGVAGPDGEAAHRWAQALQVPGAATTRHSGPHGALEADSLHLLQTGPHPDALAASGWSALGLRRYRPFVTLQRAALTARPAPESLWRPWLLAGASGLCAPRWVVPTATSAAFHYRLQLGLWRGLPLAEAVHRARSAAGAGSADALAWVSYGDPQAQPYGLVQGEGYTMMEPLGWDGRRPLAPGEELHLRVSLRRRPPLAYDGPLQRRRREPPPATRLHLQAAGLEITPPSPLEMLPGPGGDRFAWLRAKVPEMPASPGASRLQLQFLAGGDPVQDLLCDLPIQAQP